MKEVTERQQVLVFASGGDWQQVTHSYQVVDSSGEGKHPTDPFRASMPGLAQAADGLIQPKISSTRLRLI